MERRPLGKGDTVCPVGLGGWSIGGPCWRGDEPLGYSGADDRESIRAIQSAVDLGIDFFDTSDLYGCGHGERILGQALAGRRQRVRIATKFGYRIDERSRQVLGHLTLPDEIAAACDASLRRLGTDFIDLYLLHLRDLDADQFGAIAAVLDRLVEDGKIRAHGWSTDDPVRAARAAAAGCAAIEQAFNPLQGDAETLRICAASGLASIQRSPLAMGFLLGDDAVARGRDQDDVRASFDPRHPGLRRLLERAASIRQLLTSDGRTLVQGALGFLLANSGCAIPIPGFRTAAQVAEIAGTLTRGPLEASVMDAIRNRLGPSDLPANPWDLRTPRQ